MPDTLTKDSAYYVDWNLTNWAKWLSYGGLPEGLPDKASGGLENYTSLDRDSDGEYEKLDERLAEITDVVVSELDEPYKAVIKHAYGIVRHVAVWRYDAVLAQGKLMVQIGLSKRNVWLGE